MKRRRVLFIKLSQFRLFLRKCATAMLFIAALSLMILSKADSFVLRKTADMTAAFLSPLIQGMQLPAELLYAGYEKVRDVAFVYTENRELKRENLQMLMLKNQVRTLEIENALLAELLNYTPPPEAEFVSARVIAEEGDGFSHSLMAYIGDSSKVKKGQVVLGVESVVGRVESVNGSYARIILLTDINSRIPVLSERSRVRGILAGDNTLSPKLRFTARNADIKEGDMLLTSGVGGVFPSGLPLGMVRSVNKDRIVVKPLTEIENLEYVKIVSYGAVQDVSSPEQKENP